MTEQQTEKRIPKITDAVKIVTPDYQETFGLVTAVHGIGYETVIDGEIVWVPPLINAVIVCSDPNKSDSYGRQTNKDLTSLNHYNSILKMPKPGRYYDFI